jgi:hypothetical protein
MAAKSEGKFIGVSIEEFLDYGADDLKHMDELKVDKEVRAAYDAFQKSLRSHRVHVKYYVFVYWKYILVRIAGTF